MVDLKSVPENNETVPPPFLQNLEFTEFNLLFEMCMFSLVFV